MNVFMIILKVIAVLIGVVSSGAALATLWFTLVGVKAEEGKFYILIALLGSFILGMCVMDIWG